MTSPSSCQRIAVKGVLRCSSCEYTCYFFSKGDRLLLLDCELLPAARTLEDPLTEA